MIKLLILGFSIISFEGITQGAGIYIYSSEQTKLPGAITTGVHTGETKIDSYSRSFENTTTIGSITGGGGAGKAISNGITILKQYSKPSIYLKDMLFRGTNLDKMELRFYNGSDVLYYKITLGIVFVVDFLENGEGCSAGCPGISEEIKFIFGSIEEKDVLSGFSKCWSFISNTSACP